VLANLILSKFSLYYIHIFYSKSIDKVQRFLFGQEETSKKLPAVSGSTLQAQTILLLEVMTCWLSLDFMKDLLMCQKSSREFPFPLDTLRYPDKRR